MITSRVEYISPEVASKFIENGRRNRSIKTSRVRQYANSIRMGRWALNGESVVVGASGTLLDGYHRMHAIVAAGIGVSTLVARGADDAVFPTYDGGAARTAADVLTIDDVANATTVAGAVRFRLQLEAGAFNGTSTGARHLPLSNSDISGALARCEDLQLASADASGRFKAAATLLRSGSLASFLLAEFRRQDELAADAFFTGLSKGENVSSGSPVLALRNGLIKALATNSQKRSREYVAATTIKAWKAFRDGRSIQTLSWRGSGLVAEAFPSIS